MASQCVPGSVALFLRVVDQQGKHQTVQNGTTGLFSAHVLWCACPSSIIQSRGLQTMEAEQKFHTELCATHMMQPNLSVFNEGQPLSYSSTMGVDVRDMILEYLFHAISVHPIVPYNIWTLGYGGERTRILKFSESDFPPPVECKTLSSVDCLQNATPLCTLITKRYVVIVSSVDCLQSATPLCTLITKRYVVIVCCNVSGVQCRLPAECYPTLHTHYEEIGCEPVFGDGPCPLKYDCSLFMARNSSRCYLNGNEYEIGASIGNIYPMCSAACFCDGRSESGAVITCANIECAEFFRPPAPNCIPQYFLDDCCSNSTFCKNKTDDVTEVTCNVGNETFIEGQKFYPSDDDCKSCVCQQGYDGTTNGPWCKKINCGFELRSANKFRQGCAPVYYGTDRCCSIGFKCPEDESLEVVPAVVDGNASTRTGCALQAGTQTHQRQMSDTDQIRS
uniref:VWFC domain-containing protein n=1 Tax=Timema monikensis TaxID=170555 RepID=A0A7R9EGU2_9NEOP|nr:unnamed protein product [Timema monikensis]